MNKNDAHLKQYLDEELQWDSDVSSPQVDVNIDREPDSTPGAADSHPEEWESADDEPTKPVGRARLVERDSIDRESGPTLRSPGHREE